eukprot:scaffold239311_cov30-Tisochrysis_lutea.AAC.1
MVHGSCRGGSRPRALRVRACDLSSRVCCHVAEAKISLVSCLCGWCWVRRARARPSTRALPGRLAPCPFVLAEGLLPAG